MGVFSFAGKVLGATASGVGNLASGGPLKRALLGSAVGGMGGAMQGYRDPNQRTESIGKGMLLGGLTGALAFRRSSMGIPVPALGRLGKLMGGKYTAGALKGIGKAMWRNPGKTALAAGGLMAGGAVMSGLESIGATRTNTPSPSLNPVASYGTLRPAFGMDMGGFIEPGYTPETAMAAQQNITGGAGYIGTGTMMPARTLGSNAQAFMNSTAGLTQGLHRGRHG